MEHHSNHTSWFETATDVVQLQPGKDLLVDLNDLRKNLEKYKDRKTKIASVTACSNVTGIETPYYELGFGGLQVEDTVLVTKSGFRYLTKSSRELSILYARTA